MSDNEAHGPVVVWGIPVPRKANGLHMWPDELKTEAARCVLAGETVAAIVRDIQANGPSSESGCAITRTPRAPPVIPRISFR